MIEVRSVSVLKGEKSVLNHVSMMIPSGSSYAIIGSNGAGKSILLKILAGEIKPDQGMVLIDGKTLEEDYEIKEKLFYVSDYPFEETSDNAVEIQKYYSNEYPDFSKNDFYDYLINFNIDKKRKINTYSRGMKKQLAFICAICSKATYLILDETVDGLDAVIRQWMKRVVKKERKERELSLVLVSQNLRKMEELCDEICLMHEGRVLFVRKMEDIRNNIQKVQCVFKSTKDEERIISVLDIIKNEKRGSMNIFTVKGDRAEVLDIFATVNTIFFEVMPINLEEIFIAESEAVGYDIKRLMLGYLHD